MADIAATMVMKLRKMTGQGMMDCKRALQEANGDIEQAMDILRKKGLATLAKRAERETSEGIVILVEGHNWASLGTLCCETDFVARSDPFGELYDAIKKGVKEYSSGPGPENIENILEISVNGKKCSDIINETVSKTGEKLHIHEYKRYVLSGPTGLIGTYLHFNGKVGAMVEIETSDENVAATDALKQTASDIAMHITATKPMAKDKDELFERKPETIEREKSIFAEQVKNKPANIIEKIIEGKMKKFFVENCLLDQPFVKDDSKSVAEVLANTAKQAGGEAKIKRFVRFEVG